MCGGIVIAMVSRTSETELHPALNVHADEMSGEQIYIAAYVYIYRPIALIAMMYIKILDLVVRTTPRFYF